MNNSTNQQQTNDVSQLSAPAMDEVRWGFIGVGGRGRGHLNTILQLEKTRVTAISDPHAPSTELALKAVQDKGGSTPATTEAGDEEGWRRLIERDDVDAVAISTAWQQHAKMAVEAMKAGKHAFMEVPAATTIEECWAMVDTSEVTQKHCMMLENCNYGREELMLLNMVRQGVFGEILHGEAAYIHELRTQMFEDVHGCGSWRTWRYAQEQGNLYPTHGVGPIAHCMDVNRGDTFDYLVSMSSPARGRAQYARENFDADHQWNKIENWRCGDVNTSIIKLMSGKTMMVQWDETSPRPYSRHNYLQGTRGAFGGFPNRIALDYKLEDLPAAVVGSTPKAKGRTNYHVWDTHLEPWFYAYDHPLWKKVGAIAEEHGGHGGMDYIMWWRVQQCLLNGEPMDQSVYDGALWSSITPLSCASVEEGSTPQKFPDFTRGKWKTTPPVQIVE
jgi:predicted dehydrogenase